MKILCHSCDSESEIIEYGLGCPNCGVGIEAYELINDISDYEYDSEVQFNLYDNEGFNEHIMDFALKSAIEYFKDNYEGVYTIKWVDSNGSHSVDVIL